MIVCENDLEEINTIIINKNFSFIKHLSVQQMKDKDEEVK
jgi:hypothetical protein